jgi:hypothetical protein
VETLDGAGGRGDRRGPIRGSVARAEEKSLRGGILVPYWVVSLGRIVGCEEERDKATTSHSVTFETARLERKEFDRAGRLFKIRVVVRGSIMVGVGASCSQGVKHRDICIHGVVWQTIWLALAQMGWNVRLRNKGSGATTRGRRACYRVLHPTVHFFPLVLIFFSP